MERYLVFLEGKTEYYSVSCISTLITVLNVSQLKITAEVFPFLFLS